MFNLNDLRIFVRAVESGGFAAAARATSIPKSTVSKRIAELEAALGAQLIQRTSRSFALTELGQQVFAHARAAVIEAEAAETVVRRRQAVPAGPVRITASVPTAQLDLAARIPALIRAHPLLELQLHVTDRFVDLIQESFDLAVRSHFKPLPDSDLIQRRMRVQSIVLVAAPDYLARFGAPLRVDELASHHGLMGSAASKTWALRNAGGAEAEAAPKVCLVADESVVLMEAAFAGLGIACLPESVVASALTSGRLQRLLPGWTAGTVTTTILTPPRRYQLPSVRAVIDFLTKSPGL